MEPTATLMFKDRVVALVVNNPPASAGDVGASGLFPGSVRSPEEAWQPSPVFLPGESQEQRGLVGCSPWGCRESDATEAM